MPAYFRPEALAFLKGLRQNNKKEWFEANPKRKLTGVLASTCISSLAHR